MGDQEPDRRGAESMAMWRWQGGVDARLDEHSRRLNVINGDAQAAREASEELLVKVAVIQTKVALWGGLGGLLGAGVMTGILTLATHAFS